MDSFSLGSPYFMEKMLQRAIQGAVDYENAGGGWNGTVNAYNRYNLMRSPGEAISGLHLVDGPGFGENLTGPERAVQWINTGNLALSLVTGFMRPAPAGEAPPIIQPEVSVRPLGGAYKDVPAAGGEIHHAPADSVVHYRRAKDRDFVWGLRTTEKRQVGEVRERPKPIGPNNGL